MIGNFQGEISNHWKTCIMNKTCRVFALLPMKAHSERVKEKNIRLFGDRPLYAHTLLALDGVGEIGEIIINTDSERLASEAPVWSPKVRIHWRPPELCGDFVSMNKIIAYDLEHSRGEIYVQTHATNPLITSATYSAALAFRGHPECDSLFSVNRFQSRFYDAEGRPVNHDPTQLLRTQDLPSIYEENSCLYVFTKSSFAATSARIGKKPWLFATPRLASVDIDDEETWRMAEAIWRQGQP